MMLKASKPLLAHIHLSIYTLNIILAIGVTAEQVDKFIKRKSLGHLGEECFAALKSCKSEGLAAKVVRMQRDDGATMFVISMDNFDWTVEDIISVSHEALHTAVYTLGHVGVSIEQDKPNEALTYLHDDILRELFRILHPKRRRNAR